MKILVICQHYWPEPYPLSDICEELVARGHTVDLITDVPNYPMGKIYPEYQNRQRRNETHKGVNIIRTFTIPRHHNAVFRLLNYYSYSFSSSWRAKRIIKEYDVVFTNQTSPVMMSAAAFVYAKKHRKKVVMYCMDLWPACLAAGGISENSLIYKFFGKVSQRLYTKPDKILITSQMFSDYLVKQHGVDESKISYLPQYATTEFECAPEAKPAEHKETIDLMFAGNVGAAQNLNTVVEAAFILKKESRLRWHIVGDGSELENLIALANKKRLQNMIFHGRKAPEEMPKYFAMADAMLVTLTADRFISLTLPGKVQAYMAAGKPIIGAANGEIPQVIAAAQCGYCANAEDAKGLAKAVQNFLQCTNRLQLGRNAKVYYEENFARNKFMDTLEYILKQYTGQDKIYNPREK